MVVGKTIRIHTQLIGRPQDVTDEQGSWRTSIFRTPVTGPVELSHAGLTGDQVADTKHHGSPDQAVCCHPLSHYDYWNAYYDLYSSGDELGPGAVGENWTLAGVTETDVCIGDIYRAGAARVQVSSPRYPCQKQERKLKLPAFLARVVETLRTGFYVRVLEPGQVQAGDVWVLEARPYPDLTVQRINECGHHTVDADLARRAVEVVELASMWRSLLTYRLTGQWLGD